MRIIITIATLLLTLQAFAAEPDSELLSSARRATVEAQKMIESGQPRQAESLLAEAIKRYPRDAMLLTTYGDVLFQLERYGEAEIAFNQALDVREVELARSRLEEIAGKYEQYASNIKLAVIMMQKNSDAGNYDTAIAIGNRAILNFPDSEEIYNAKGEALYRKDDLDAAEEAFRKALQIDPKNKEARAYVEEIRITEQAQTSTEVAEWISIAKDKVGDFIVTFLALFTAFVVNSLIEPLTLRIKLRNARRIFEQGKYDEFTDLIEGLLDAENFTPIRANMRFMLRNKSYDEAQAIFNKYVNSLDRLPTLLRILEREHEKMLETA